MILWKLDALLRARRIRGRELAARLGVGENYLSRIRREPPERLSLSLLDALCRELGVGIEQLLVQVPDEGEGVSVAPPPPIAVRARRPARQAAPPMGQATAPPLPPPAPEPIQATEAPAALEGPPKAPALRLALRPRRRPSAD